MKNKKKVATNSMAGCPLGQCRSSGIRSQAASYQWRKTPALGSSFIPSWRWIPLEMRSREWLMQVARTCFTVNLKWNRVKSFYNMVLAWPRLPLGKQTHISYMSGQAAIVFCLEGWRFFSSLIPGGHIVLVSRTNLLETPKNTALEPLMDTLEAEGRWKKIARDIVGKMYLDYDAIVWHYQKL